MISIITCSINPHLLKQFTNSLDSTIGIAHELIAFDNRNLNWGLCKVYNSCAQKAKFDYLLFVHEDIIFHTNNWGRNLIKHLANNPVGLVGIAGSTYKSRLPGPWWGVGNGMNKIHIIQHQGKKKTSVVEKLPKTEEVVVIDGVFMACRKEIWKATPFDEVNFDRFHNYDIDFSLAIKQTHKVFCINDILIEHLSIGSYNRDWLNSCIKISKKWKSELPISTHALDEKSIKRFELYSYEKFIQLLVGRTKKISWLLRHFITYLQKGGKIKFVIIQLRQWIRR